MCFLSMDSSTIDTENVKPKIFTIRSFKRKFATPFLDM